MDYEVAMDSRTMFVPYDESLLGGIANASRAVLVPYTLGCEVFRWSLCPETPACEQTNGPASDAVRDQKISRRTRPGRASNH